MKNYEFQINATDKTKAAFNSVNKSLNSVNRNAAASGKSVGNLGRNAGQAGIQIQQFVGQVQGGQSALLALSQQGADLGLVLGAPLVGAIIGIGASMASFMIPGLRDAKTSMEELEEVSESLSRKLIETSEGTYVFTEALQDLAGRSESLARVEIAKGIIEAEKQIKVSAKNINETLSDFGSIRIGIGLEETVAELGIQLEDLPRLVGDISNEVDKLGAGGVLQVKSITERVQLLADRFGLTFEQAGRLQTSLDAFGSDGGASGIKNLENTLSDLNDETGSTNEKIINLTSSLVPFFESSTTAVDQTNLFKQAQADLQAVLSDSADETGRTEQKTRDYTTALFSEIIALESGAQAAEVYSTVQRLVGTEQESQIPQVIELINKKYALRDAQLASAEAAKQEALEWNEVEREYAEFLRRMESAEELELRQTELREKKLEDLRLEVEAYQKGAEAIELLNASRELGIGATEEEIQSYIRLKQQLEDFQQAQQIQREGYQALLDIAGAYYEGMEGKQAAYARAAIQIAGTLLDEEKRTAIASIMTNTYETAMKAYKALAGIPYVGPVLGAVAAAGVITAGGAYAAKVSGIASFDGGGYTGSGSRVGGVDGKGGFPAILHPNETVIDHTKGQSAGGMTFNFSPQIIGDFDEMAMQSLQRRSKQFTRMVTAAVNNNYA